MPTYNMAQYIGEAIESIIKQTYTNWELIVVDDGSTDNTETVVRSFVDPRIRYIRQERLGRGGARNAALRVARGEYIAITDADDISLPRRFEMQVDYLQKYPKIAVVGGQILHFADGKMAVSLNHYPTTVDEVRKCFRKGIMGVPHPASMLSAEVFRRIGLYCEECLRAQDLELFLRVSHHYQMTNLKDVVLMYRNDPRRTSFSFWMRLHLFHEYAMYRYQCYRDGVQPKPYKEWRKRVGVWIKLLTWHSARYIKMHFSVRAGWHDAEE